MDLCGLGLDMVKLRHGLYMLCFPFLSHSGASSTTIEFSSFRTWRYLRKRVACLAIWWTLFVGGGMRLDISKEKIYIYYIKLNVIKKKILVGTRLCVPCHLFNFKSYGIFLLSIILIPHINTHNLSQLFCVDRRQLFV